MRSHRYLWVWSLTMALTVAMVSGQFPTRDDPYSVCTTDLYRELPLGSQNEHQCLLMEQFNKEFFSDREDRIRRYKELNTGLQDINSKLNEILSNLDVEYDVYYDKQRKKNSTPDKSSPSNHDCNSTQFTPNIDMRPLHDNCLRLKKVGGVTVSGVYPLKMHNGDIILAHCDMDRGGGGWTLIQRRLDGSVNFNRNWTEYKYGFGNPNSEYWLGLEYIHLMSANTNMSLRVDLWDWEGKRARAEYTVFYVTPEVTNYTLLVDGYHGSTGDSLAYHNNCSFSTPERDNDALDGNCAEQDGAGWWYKACSYTALNSKYHSRTEVETGDKLDGVFWYHWKETYTYPLPKVEMKIRPWKTK